MGWQMGRWIGGGWVRGEGWMKRHIYEKVMGE